MWRRLCRHPGVRSSDALGRLVVRAGPPELTALVALSSIWRAAGGAIAESQRAANPLQGFRPVLPEAPSAERERPGRQFGIEELLNRAGGKRTREQEPLPVIAVRALQYL